MARHRIRQAGDIIQMIADGKGNREIVTATGASLSTVKRYRRMALDYFRGDPEKEELPQMPDTFPSEWTDAVNVIRRYAGEPEMEIEEPEDEKTERFRRERFCVDWVNAVNVFRTASGKEPMLARAE